MHIINSDSTIKFSNFIQTKNLSQQYLKRLPLIKINTQPSEYKIKQFQIHLTQKQQLSAEKKNKNEMIAEKRKISLVSPTKNSVGKIRKYTQQTLSPALNKISLIKKSSEQNPVMEFQKTHIKFHQIFDNLPKLKQSKKYEHLCQRSRYFQVVRKPIQQTIQKLSAQSWVVFDYSHQKYIKGWKNNETKCVSNLYKVLIINTLLRMFHEDSQKKLQRIIIRTHKIYSKDEYLLQNNTKITLKELMFGIMLTSSQQISDYITINMGYYISKLKNLQYDIWIDSQTNSEKQTLEIFIENNSKNKFFKNVFQNQMKTTLEEFQFSNSFIKDNQFYSCAMELCILFNSCLNYELFREMISSKYRISNIRFQVGYNYWEQRKIKWKNQFYWPKEYFGICIGFKGNGNSVLAYNKKHELLLILVQGRYFKTLNDLQNIKTWCLQSQKLYDTKQQIQKQY